MDVTYHRATSRDIDILVSYRLMFLAERSPTGKVVDGHQLEENLRDYFIYAMAAGEFIAWLAKSDGKVIATSGLVIWRMPPNNSVRTGRQGYILNMYTVPEARRQGICAALLEKMIDEARSLGLSRVHLHASKMGENVYRRRGFAEPSDVELVLKLD